MEYAINTSAEVIHADGRYYAVQHGVWFVADSSLGPWAVADMIPAEIYTIPPSCPLYHDRYVYVYGATPDVCLRGYTPGYMGAFVSDGVVVFGTGWWYPGWCGFCPPFPGLAGRGPGDSDSDSATGAAVGSGGRLVITGGITTRRLAIESSPNIIICSGAPRTGLGFVGT